MLEVYEVTTANGGNVRVLVDPKDVAISGDARSLQRRPRRAPAVREGREQASRRDRAPHGQGEVVMREQLDCQSCGACCVEAGPVSVNVYDSTPRWRTRSIRYSMPYTEQDVRDGVRQMDKYLGGRCKALAGVVCKSVSCRIYDTRPAVCRTFEPGSAGCLESRATALRKAAAPEDDGYRGYGTNWKRTVT